MTISAKDQIRRIAGDPIHAIAQEIEGKWGFQRVVIVYDTTTSQFRRCSQRSFWEVVQDIVFRIFHWCAPEQWKEDNRSSIKYFYEILGEKTITHIDAQWGMGLRKKLEMGLPLIRRDVERLFVGLADVDVIRAESLFNAVVGKVEEKGLGTLEIEAKKELQARFQGKIFKELSKADWDALWPYLVPFNAPEDIILAPGPDTSFYARYFGGTFNKLKSCLYLQEKVMGEKPADRVMLWELWVGGKPSLLKQANRMGSVVRHPHGYYKLSHEIEGGGLSALFLKALTETSDAFRSCIKFLPTRSNPLKKDTWLSWRDNLAAEVGEHGLAAATPTIRYLMQSGKRPHDFEAVLIDGDRDESFSARDEPIWVQGYSQGGAQAMGLAARNLDLEIVRLVTVCSPKILAKTCQEFAENIRRWMHIRHYIEIDDPTSNVGEEALGVNCDDTEGQHVELFVCSPDSGMTRPEVTEALMNPPNLPEKFFLLFLEFLHNFFNAHPRNTTLMEGHRVTIYSNDRKEDLPALNSGLVANGLEHNLRLPVRKSLKKIQEMGESVLSSIHVQLKKGAAYWSPREVKRLPKEITS